MKELINKLKSALLKQLPGIQIQYEMAPLHRQRPDIQFIEPQNFIKSAVMILLCKDEKNEWFIPLTQRYKYEGHHSAQISLPGGKYEVLDECMQNTALRECNEEIGNIENILVLGKLTTVYIPISGYMVEPYLGICKEINPNFNIDVKEVKSLIKLTLTKLLDDTIVMNGIINNGSGNKVEAPYFKCNNHKIWGATAMILNELKVILKTEKLL